MRALARQKSANNSIHCLDFHEKRIISKIQNVLEQPLNDGILIAISEWSPLQSKDVQISYTS